MPEPVKVESYGQIAFDGAWKGRARGLWGTSAVGLGFGALIGTVAPFFPALVTGDFSSAAAQLPTSLAIFSATGLATGFTAGVGVGTTAGGLAAVAKEQELRARERDLALGFSTPEEEALLSARTEAAPDTRGFWQKLKDGIRNYINPGPMLAFAAMGAIGGAVLAAGFIAGGGTAAVPALGALVGAGASETAITAYFVGLTASFGALFGFNMPRMVTDAQYFMGEMLSGKAIHSPWPEQAKEARTPAIFKEAPVNELPEKSFAAAEKRAASYQELLAQQDRHSGIQTLH